MDPHPPAEEHHQAPLQRPLAPVVHQPHFKLAATCLIFAVLIIPIEAASGGCTLAPGSRQLALATIVAFVLLAATGVRMAAVECGRAVHSRGEESSATTIEVIITVVGCLLILLATLDLVGLSPKNLLLCGVAIGLVLTAALQQTLANIFAGGDLVAYPPVHRWRPDSYPRVLR